MWNLCEILGCKVINFSFETDACPLCCCRKLELFGGNDFVGLCCCFCFVFVLALPNRWIVCRDQKPTDKSRKALTCTSAYSQHLLVVNGPRIMVHAMKKRPHTIMRGAMCLQHAFVTVVVKALKHVTRATLVVISPRHSVGRRRHMRCCSSCGICGLAPQATPYRNLRRHLWHRHLRLRLRRRILRIFLRPRRLHRCCFSSCLLLLHIL